MIEAAWRVGADHPAFEGHFPQRPILPGVALLDFALFELERSIGTPIHGWRIASVKFPAPVAPGSTLTCGLHRVREAFEFEILAGTVLVASGRAEPWVMT